MMIGKTISHYKITEELGRGGMGVVYKAIDTKLGRSVAIKFLPQHLSSDPEATRRFVNEAKAASALDHQHIGTIHEVNETEDGLTYIVMAYYEGRTLRERIDRGDISIEEALDLTSQIAKALSKAHQKGIIHRDIKPSNVIITSDGEAKLVDFGLAKLAGATRLTRTGSTMGTVAYMSPEQAGGGEADARTDIWALGVMLYEMLGGRQPFRGEYEPAVLYAIMNEEPEAVSAARKDLPVEIENIVDRALSKKLTERYQTAEELLTDLETQQEKLKLGPKGRGLLAMRRKSRQRFLRISVPAVLIAAAIVLIIIFQPFELEIRPKTKEAIARENSIVVLPFENLMDPEDEESQAGMATSLLTIALRESEYMNVVNEGRVNDVLKQMDRADYRTLSSETSEEVARRTGSNWILTGKVIQSEPNIVLSATIANATTGRDRWSGTVRGDVGEDIFTAIERLKAEIGKELALPPEAMAQLDRAVTEVTTSNPEAYRYYLMGHREGNRMMWDEAMAHFEKAIQLDSTFALAYLGLGMYKHLNCWEAGKCDPALVRKCYEKASEHSDKLSAIQKLELQAFGKKIQWDFKGEVELLQQIVEKDPQYKRIWSWLGDYSRICTGDQEQAIRYYNKAIELDSTSASDYGWLAMSYAILDDLGMAGWAVEKYMSLEPDNVQAHYMRAFVYREKGEIEAAIHHLEECERLAPGYETMTLAEAYFNAERYSQADSIYRALAAGSNATKRWHARWFIPCIPMAQGRLDEALRMLDDGIAADRMEGQNAMNKHLQRARIMMHNGRQEEALEEFLTAKRLSGNERSIRMYNICALAMTGAIEAAEDSLEDFRGGLDFWYGYNRGFYSLPRGMIEMAKGNPDSAFFYLEQAAADIDNTRLWNSILQKYYLAEAYLEAGRPADAARVIDDAIRHRYRNAVYHGHLTAKTYHLAGKIYEALGDSEKAVQYYEEFLNRWRAADQDLPEVPDARKRLARLVEGK